MSDMPNSIFTISSKDAFEEMRQTLPSLIADIGKKLSHDDSSNVGIYPTLQEEIFSIVRYVRDKESANPDSLEVLLHGSELFSLALSFVFLGPDNFYHLFEREDTMDENPLSLPGSSRPAPEKLTRSAALTFFRQHAELAQDLIARERRFVTDDAREQIPDEDQPIRRVLADIHIKSGYHPNKYSISDSFKKIIAFSHFLIASNINVSCLFNKRG